MSEVLLEIRNLSKEYKSKKSCVKALSNFSISIKKGETVGIVGESGCGKTTVGRCIARAIDATSGEVIFTTEDGTKVDFLKLDKKELKKHRSDIQMIFQDPYASLDPRMTVYDIISEPLKANFKYTKEEIKEKIISIAERTKLNVSYLRRYPHAFSGGQRQRIGVARALVAMPKLVICDEPVSALDVSVQAQIINLLKELQKDFDLTYIFISHNLAVIEHISDRVGVMYLGKLVEVSSKEDLFLKPLHPYTMALLSATPIADPTKVITRIILEGEIPNPENPPSGCYFHPRCRYCIDACKETVPEFIEISKDRFVACHRAQEFLK